MHQEEYVQQVKRGDPAFLLGPGDATSSAFCSIQAFTVQDKELQGESPDDEGSGSCLL